MNRIVAWVVLGTFAGGLLAGCANIQDDRTRTQTEGTMVGAGVGAATGALIGAIVGGKKGALVGAGIGGAVGGLAGAAVGTHIADQKEKYASEEAWLDACLQQARQTNDRLKAYNEELAGQITTLDKETKKLQRAYAAKKAQKNTLIAQQKKVEETIQGVNQQLAGVEQEIAGQQKVLADAKANNKKDESALLEAEIASLQRHKAQLETKNKQLAAMSARMSV